MTSRFARAAIALAAMAIGCRASGPPNQGKTNTMDSLAGKLVIKSTHITSSEGLEVNIELTNQGSSAVQIPSGNPFSFRAIVRDGRGATVAPTLQRLDVLSKTTWVRAEPGKPTTVSATIKPEAGYQLDTTTQVWRLPAGKYEFAGRFIVEAKADGAPGDAWSGAIDLAPVAFEILP